MSALPPGLAPATYAIDPSHSQASFAVRHAGISRVSGTVPISSGTITVDATIESSSVVAELNGAKITTGDDGRDAHLRGADFFKTDKHPRWSFNSTAVSLKPGENFTLTGDLEINGVSKPVEMQLEYTGSAIDPFGPKRAAFEARTEISRKDWGITWNAMLETGGFLVSDKVRLTLDISAVVQD